ncbi:MAG TPA: hypothetical protein VGR82_17525 [Methylomirabilota bacterium]|nr:hypothetical protein [Methylomirabilota bacterium]
MNRWDVDEALEDEAPRHGAGWVLEQLVFAYLVRVWLPFCGWLLGSWWAPFVPVAALAAFVVWVCV